MGKKQRSKQDIIQFDQQARKEGASKKHFSIHDLRVVYPKTENQHTAFETYFSGNNISLIGSAGTGKSFIGMYLALNDVLGNDQRYQKVVIIRSAVSVRNQGFVPGDIHEKEALYEEPYSNICDELFEYSKSYDNLKKGGYIEFMTTSYMRGITLDNAVVIIDETQNCNFEEISTIITRLGKHSKIIILGDTAQDDLKRLRNDSSGLPNILRILDNMDEFDCIKFNTDDIVRSKLVRNFIIQKEKLNL